MAQAYPDEKIKEKLEKLEIKDGKKKEIGTSSSSTSSSTSGNNVGVPFKFNVQAPEFVPSSYTQMPISGYFYPCFHYIAGNDGADWLYVGNQDSLQLVSPPSSIITNNCTSKDVLTDELKQKIIKQVCILYSLFFRY